MNVRASNETPLDWHRIRHLLKLGIFAALMVLSGDMLLAGVVGFTLMMAPDAALG